MKSVFPGNQQPQGESQRRIFLFVASNAAMVRLSILKYPTRRKMQIFLKIKSPRKERKVFSGATGQISFGDPQ